MKLLYLLTFFIVGNWIIEHFETTLYVGGMTVKALIFLALIWFIASFLKNFISYLTNYPLLSLKRYKYYENGMIKSITHPKYLNSGYKLTFYPSGALFKKEYMHRNKILEDGYELYYPSGRLKYKHLSRNV